MSFYEHFFWNYTFFRRKPWAWKVGLGGIVPDLIYMAAFLPKLFSYQSFGDWMRDPLWDKVWDSFPARAMHSFTIWGIVFLCCWLIVKRGNFELFYPFLIGWGLHIAVDALTHVSDGYAIFYPLSEYRFPAPVSYWERDHHAREFFIVTHSLMAGFLLMWSVSWLKRHFKKRLHSAGTTTITRGDYREESEIP